MPEIGKSLGSGMREFKDSVTGSEEPKELSAAAVETAEPVRNEHKNTV